MTPLLDRCGVAGVMRRWILDTRFELRLRSGDAQTGLETRDGAWQHANRTERRRGKWQRVVTGGDVGVFFRF